jgi:hypothetical protein
MEEITADRDGRQGSYDTVSAVLHSFCKRDICCMQLNIELEFLVDVDRNESGKEEIYPIDVGPKLLSLSHSYYEDEAAIKIGALSLPDYILHVRTRVL